jgi:hypothetical protein
MEDKVKDFFEEAFRRFSIHERTNILNVIHEQNLSCRLALELELIKVNFGFPGYYADTEYNRQRNNIKKSREGIKFRPDVIVHSRYEIIHRDNLIAIEMKKAGQPRTNADDNRRRLMDMTRPLNPHNRDAYGYELGMFIEINISEKMFILEEFRKGNSISVERRSLENVSQ